MYAWSLIWQAALPSALVSVHMASGQLSSAVVTSQVLAGSFSQTCAAAERIHTRTLPGARNLLRIPYKSGEYILLQPHRLALMYFSKKTRKHSSQMHCGADSNQFQQLRRMVEFSTDQIALKDPWRLRFSRKKALQPAEADRAPCRTKWTRSSTSC